MTQPKFAPILVGDEVRETSKLPAPEPWIAHRPADFQAEPGAVRRPGRGSAGPDQGYALLLAERFADRLRLEDGERADDVLHGAGVIAMRRASIFGRAPISADLELALALFGYLVGGAGAGLDVSDGVIAARQPIFRGVSHDYWRERELADMVPEATLRLTPAGVAQRLAREPGAWAALTGMGPLPV